MLLPLLAVLLIASASSALSGPSSAVPPSGNGSSRIKIGVLAYRGEEQALRMWAPTAAYLSRAVPGYTFSIVPLDFHQIEPAVSQGTIDFIIANTGIYVALEAKYGVTRIATMKNRIMGGAYTSFGGVIFCRADRQDIRELEDLNGRSFIAVDETSLGGWQMAWGELVDHGIDPYRQFAPLRFGGTHDAVVYAVRDGSADAGTVRTDTLERMEAEGLISLSDYRILNSRTAEDFPFVRSTPLYPEWPFAKIRNTPSYLSERVLVALLTMPADSAAASAARIEGWTIPMAYQGVHDLFKRLRIYPYHDFGRVSLGQTLHHYRFWIGGTGLIMLLLAFALVLILRLNRRLSRTATALTESRNGLEDQVQERTAALKQLTVEQEKSNRFLQTIIDSVAEPMIVIGMDYRIRLMNRAAKEVSPRGTFCYNISHDRDEPCEGSESHPCPLREVTESKSPAVAIHRHRRQDGGESTVEINAFPVLADSAEVEYVIEICRDITDKVEAEREKQRFQERLFQREKEESILTLAGGIAHDFNNILMAVLGNAEMLRLEQGLPVRATGQIDHIITAVERMADLNRQLLAYAKGGRYIETRVRINDLVRDALRKVPGTSGRMITIDLGLAPDAWDVTGDPAQLCQALVNLLRNAAEAMEKTGGTVRVTTSNESGKASWECRHHHHHPGGDYIHLSVADSGPGISEETATRIYEPFYSTKFLGRGLGLAAVVGIIQGHAGCVYHENGSDGGTTFHIFLPRAGSEKQVEEKQKSRGIRRIMVVDDEPEILAFLETILTRTGYAVLTASSGEKAINTLRVSRDPVEVVVLDVQMPGMSGSDVLRQIRKMRPETKILIATGFDEARAALELAPHAPDGFLQKPFPIRVLREKLHDMLAG